MGEEKKMRKHKLVEKSYENIYFFCETKGNQKLPIQKSLICATDNKRMCHNMNCSLFACSVIKEKVESAFVLFNISSSFHITRIL